MNTHEPAALVEEKFLTPGVMVLLAVMALGFAFAVPGWSPDGTTKTAEQVREEYLRENPTPLSR